MSLHDRPPETPRTLRSAVESICNAWNCQPRAAIILGTGLGGFVDSMQLQTCIDYRSLPGFPQATSIGHRGQLACGRLADTPIVAFQGRVHLYEGYRFAEVTLPVRIAWELGAEMLLVTNASGGVNPLLSVGDIVAISDHINLMGRAVAPGSTAIEKPDQPPFEPLCESPAEPSFGGRRSLGYCPRLLRAILQAGRAARAPIVPGVYVGMLGPNYETRAEYRMARRLGGDVVGMSTIPEVLEANRLGLRVAGLSTVTNVAHPDRLDKTSGAEVAQAAADAAADLGRTIAAFLTNAGTGAPQ
ncbi:MAG: purine-nucleoside phosphorylase [Planctomycetes bacterium]|nr:purine-nucleoside phosphorylase [Planctomycetota bacterium]